MEKDRNGVAKRRLKIRRKYPEESVDTFESVGKGDYSRATFPFGRCANRAKHTNNASLSNKLAGHRKENLSKKTFLVIRPCGRNGN